MKKSAITLLIALALLCTSAAVFAEEQPTQETDPNATHLTVAYPNADDILPIKPVPPTNLKDFEAINVYIQSVNAYLKAVQAYVDGTTNDINAIIEKRNLAIQKADQIIEEYNNFADSTTK